ncbi:lung surfactant protein A-like protein [Dinothrombium tinctorium]|uniref:Lung surfactant protein A-like protein n=1 Tax=Dinothrombium tinctorium TaxID=1965070 RepID=A0A3S3NMA0_9ACAR|nr:lung surfactant protein A-like protein [Dinothrombium tinctorium]RWS05625.1 lung surfactant protein A-like protein [Dinothrombium tinctorium]RWS06303.1 lung surfactant protein A-like protein [Dinothrombium tinctorium]
MAIIHSKEENDFVAGLVPGGTWTFLGGKTTGNGSTEFEWLDGSAADFYNWEPSEIEPNQGIVIRQDGKWSFSELPDTRPVLCQRSLTKCVPENVARIKKTETIVGALEGGITRLLKHFSSNQKAIKSEVSNINTKLNETEENIEALHESSYGLQKQIDIIVSYLSRFSQTLQELAGFE